MTNFRIVQLPSEADRDPDAPDLAVLEANMNAAIRAGWTVWVKWTCPACGERAISDLANTFCADGHIHTEKADGSPCNTIYTGTRYGFGAAKLLASGDAEAQAQALAALRAAMQATPSPIKES